MPPDHRPDDEDTQENAQPPAYPAHAPGTAAAPGDGAGSPRWSSQGGRQGQLQGGPSEQAGSGWQQPVAPAWQRPVEPAWQQPPDWPPQVRWAQAGYWPAVPQYSNNPLVVIAGIILIIFGIIVTLAGLAGMLLGMAVVALMEEFMPPDVQLEFDIAAFSTIVVVVMGIVLVLGVLHFVSGIGVFLHKGWGRAIGIVLGALGLLVGVAGSVLVFQDGVSAQEAGRQATGPLIVATAYGLTLFALIAGGGHFRARYPG